MKLKLRHLVGVFSVLFFALSQNTFSQSVEELENMIFNTPYPQAEQSAPVMLDRVEEAPKTFRKKARRQDYQFREKKSKQSKLERVDDIIYGPRDIPMTQTLIVQNRYIQKRAKHELMPFSLGLQPGDSFRKQLSFSMGYTYHFSENWGLELLHVGAFTGLSSNLREELRKHSLEIERVEPVYSFTSSLQWSAFNAKAAAKSNIYRFQAYLFAGGGMTIFEEDSSGVVTFGVGARVFMNRFAALKFELRDYYDLRDATEQRVNLMLGASVLLGGGK